MPWDVRDKTVRNLTGNVNIYLMVMMIVIGMIRTMIMEVEDVINQTISHPLRECFPWDENASDPSTEIRTSD